MPNRRKFIDKKKSITFQLVHRSQHDPLIVDDTVGERVLVPLDSEKRKNEQKKYGIEFDDDYDYLQHLRDPCAPPEQYSVHVDKNREETDELEDDDDDQFEDVEDDDEEEEEEEEMYNPDDPIHRFQLPSTVFESRTTNEIGMLNLAAPDSDPKIHWDPDVIAALDDDFNYQDTDNALDDDFMLKANGTEPLAEEECDEFEDEVDDECPTQRIPPLFIPKNNKPIPLALQRFLDIDDGQDEEMKSNYSASADDDRDRQTSKTKYTNYSMTSSVIRRNQGLQNVDDHFDKIFDEYDDEQIGPLDSYSKNPKGVEIDEHLIQQTMKQFEDQKIENDEDVQKAAIEKTKKLASRLVYDDEETTTIFVEEDKNNLDKWDCETILTTYSNIYNHPKLITLPSKQRIRLSNKTGLPLSEDSKKSSKETKTVEEQETDDEDQDDNLEDSSDQMKISFERKKGETSEERRARKHAIKEFRRDRRSMKKATKLAFKQEEQKQLHEQVLHAAQAHLQTLRVV